MEWFKKSDRKKSKTSELALLRKGGSAEAVLRRTLPLQLHDLHEQAGRPVYRERDGAAFCDVSATSGRDLKLAFPLRIRITAAKGGQVDLQLRLVEFYSGTEVKRCQRTSVPWQEARSLAGKASSLVFLSLAFPDLFPAVETCLAAAGAATAAGKVAQIALRKADRHWSPRGSFALPRRIQRVWERREKFFRSRLAGARTAASQATQYASAAALLAAAAVLWKCLDPSSHQLMQAITVAIQLSSGYASTKRQAVQGRIKAGPQLEAAWRARHKWAAQKAARVLTDANSSPPLVPLMTAAQGLSIGMLLLLQGSEGGHPSGSMLGGPLATAVYGAAGHDSAWAVTASFLAGRRLPEEADSPSPKASGAANQGAALVNEGSAGQNTPAGGQQQTGQAYRGNAQLSHPPVTGNLTRENPSEASASQPSEGFESSFLPSATESLVTGELPTICSNRELEEFASRQAAEGAACQGGALECPQITPFAVAANATAAAQQVDAPTGSQGNEVPEEIAPFVMEELHQLEPALKSRRPWNRADEVRFGQNLALYGRADHLKEEPLTVLEKQSLVLRAFYLMTIFMPFFLLAPLLLLLSRGRRKPTPAVVTEPPQTHELIGEDVAEPSEEDSGAAVWRLLLFSIRNGGAAFIKWGQWSATREDMFPIELCRVLANLHDQAPTHSWAESQRSIEAAFGRTVEELFVSIEEKPIASGSIAQVHRAVMIVAGKRRSVAVKVRHPGVDIRIKQDFQILKAMAEVASKVKALKRLNLKEGLAQFSSTMTAQTDLRVEAVHLMRFFRNFAPVRDSVTPPLPLPGYVTESVIIETFEPGQSVAKYIRNPAPFNTQIVALGVDTYLKMLLVDNFVHTDLHPGNILVRRRDGGGLSTETGAADVRGRLQLVLLDFGLAEELTPEVRQHFISFLHMIAAGNGERAAFHILRWSRDQRCPDPAGFTMAMKAMFVIECNIHTPQGIELDRVMKSVLRLARQFDVNIDSSYAALVIGVVVLVGFATSLDPGVNLMDAAAPAFLQNSLLGKVSGRLYS